MSMEQLREVVLEVHEAGLRVFLVGHLLFVSRPGVTNKKAYEARPGDTPRQFVQRIIEQERLPCFS